MMDTFIDSGEGGGNDEFIYFSFILSKVWIASWFTCCGATLLVPPCCFPDTSWLCVAVCHLLTSSSPVSSFLQMLLSLFPAVVLLLSLRAARVDGVAAPPLTFKDTDRMTGASLECDRCPPGTYLRARCTSTQKSQCAPCPSGSFTELWNYIGKCLRCDVCGQNQVVKRACTADSNCHCECKQGYYYKTEYDMCIGHSACPVGEGVLSNGRLLSPGPG